MITKYYYFLKALKVNSVDYPLKPISVEELSHAIEKFKSIHHHHADLTRIESLINQLQPRVKERFLIKICDHYQSIPVTVINCFFIKERCNFISIDKQRTMPSNSPSPYRREDRPQTLLPDQLESYHPLRCYSQYHSLLLKQTKDHPLGLGRDG